MKNILNFFSAGYLSCKGALLPLMICLALVSACTRNYDTPGVASLSVFNGVVGAGTLVPDLSDTNRRFWYKAIEYVNYGNGGSVDPGVLRNTGQFNASTGTQRIRFLKYPDTLPHNKPILDLKLAVPVGTISSLFLTGTVDAPDTLFIRENFPWHSHTDSVTSIRVVNLVPGLNASVNLQGNAVGSEVESLGFKSLSPFKNYPVTGQGTQYVFEVRDAATGNLLLTRTVDARDRKQSTSSLNNYRFRNFTLVIYGQLGNTTNGAPNTVIMTNN